MTRNAMRAVLRVAIPMGLFGFLALAQRFEAAAAVFLVLLLFAMAGMLAGCASLQTGIAIGACLAGVPGCN